MLDTKHNSAMEPKSQQHHDVKDNTTFKHVEPEETKGEHIKPEDANAEDVNTQGPNPVRPSVPIPNSP